jgi:hypothetical protein
VHAQFDWRGLHTRALFTMTHVDDAASLTAVLRPEDQGGIGMIGDTEVIASQMLGGYGEISYDLLQWLFPGSERTLEPFFRFEYLDTQYDVPAGFTADESKAIQVYTTGLQFKPIPNVVLKADYRNKVAEAGSAPDEFNLGIGLAF